MSTAIPIPEAELSDPDVLTDDQVDGLLVGAPWRRFVVVGDSIAKGVGESAPGYRRIVWAERVAAGLERARPGLVYVNLATPEQTAREILDTQLERAKAFGPDLAAYVGGGNDLLVEQFDVEPVARLIDETLAGLAETGATLITFSMMDLPGAFPDLDLEELDRRLRLLNDAVADVAGRYDALHIDLHSHPRSRDPELYSSDMKHGNMRGQAFAASETIKRLAEAIRGRAR